MPADVQKLVKDKQQEILDGKLVVFQGPVKDQNGNVKIADGVKPTIDQLESSDYLVEGVIGTIPK